jgi:MFS transporter, UMF1 family
MNRSEVGAPPVTRREIFAWAMYDFANSGYTTVVLTAIFSVYFVSVVAGGSLGQKGTATLLWTVATSITNIVVLLTAPILGAIADYGAHKKRILAFTTAGCVVFTAALGWVGQGDIVLGMVTVILSYLMFATGENIIAAFLPEIATAKNIGRISGYGWSLGFVGGVFVLWLCLLYVQAAEAQGLPATAYVPVTLWLTALVFGLAAIPTFVWLRERAQPRQLPPGQNYLRLGFARVRQTLKRVRHYRDLFRFLIALSVYYCGVNTVIVLTAVYAQQVMGFTMSENIVLLIVANISAAAGAFAFGFLQDSLGSVRTLAITLVLWIVALTAVYFIESRLGFWAAANLIGIALGATQSAGRALVGQFSPVERAAEFFGLWGLAGKLAAVVGPATSGIIAFVTHGDLRMALASTIAFFAVGLVLLLGVDERRGRAAAVAVP